MASCRPNVPIREKERRQQVAEAETRAVADAEEFLSRETRFAGLRVNRPVIRHIAFL
ncbi:hypothetical protein Holit_00372 [Hollandina sp. SP2]